MRKILILSLIILLSTTGCNSVQKVEDFKELTDKNVTNEEVIILEKNNEIIDSNDEITDFIHEETEVITSEKTKVEEEKKESSIKKEEKTKSSDISNVKKESSTSKETESNSSKSENKKLSKSEIEEYLKKNVPDFRYDFDTVKDCQDEGDKWAEYGWFYNCPYVSVPNSDIKPVMLIVSTGKFFCDGKYTKNEKIYWKKPKVSSISYLREIGYLCENIEGTN